VLTLLIEFFPDRDRRPDQGGGDAQTDDDHATPATGDAQTDDDHATPTTGDAGRAEATGDRPAGQERESPVSVDEADGTVVLTVGGQTRALTPAEATRLRAALGEAVADRRAFVHTVGRRRPDGSYVVRRRDSETAGNSVVFDSFRALERLYDRLPATVDAETVGREHEGVTGSRRHLVVWHLAEHPAFDARVTSRSPLRVRVDRNGADDSRAGDATASGDD